MTFNINVVYRFLTKRMQIRDILCLLYIYMNIWGMHKQTSYCGRNPKTANSRSVGGGGVLAKPQADTRLARHYLLVQILLIYFCFNFTLQKEDNCIQILLIKRFSS